MVGREEVWTSLDIPGLSMDGHGYSGICGYSDIGVGEGGHPWIIHGWSRLTLASADTLTGGRGMDIPGLSMDGHTMGIR